MKEGALSAMWHVEAANADAIALAGDRIGYLAGGVFRVKEGALSAMWHVEAANADAIALSYVDTPPGGRHGSR